MLQSTSAMSCRVLDTHIYQLRMSDCMCVCQSAPSAPCLPHTAWTCHTLHGLGPGWIEAGYEVVDPL